MKKIVSGIMLTLILIGMLTLTFSIQPVKANPTIYIRSGGSVEGTDKIQPSGAIYTFTSNINDSIIVQRSNIVIDGAGYTLQGTGSGKGIDLSERHNATVKNMTIKLFNYGIWLSGASHHNLTRNNITNNYIDGIHLVDSSDNSISENNITNNDDGIKLDNSNYNTIFENNITNNNHQGVELYSSSNYNAIVRNNIENNKEDGIYLSESSDNLIYHNNFINNTDQVHTYSSTNSWNENYPSGGNYWSDYNGTDLYSGPYQNETGSDGIGDTPYIINANNRDQYPKVHASGGGFNWWPIVIIIAVLAFGVVAIAAVLIFRRKPSVTTLPPSPPPPPPPPP